jgi:hypothetical protein
VRRVNAGSGLFWPIVVCLAAGFANAYLAYVHRDSTFRCLFDAVFAVFFFAACAVSVLAWRDLR